MQWKRAMLVMWVFLGGSIFSQPVAVQPLWQQLAQARTPEDSIRIQAELSRHYVVHGLDTAVRVVEQALWVARKRKQEDRWTGEAYYRAGVVYHRKSDFIRARALLDTAKTCYRKSNYPLGEGLALNSLAAIEGVTGHYPEAVDLLVQALNIADQLPPKGDNSRLRGMCLNNLGGVYFGLQNYQQTILYCKRSITFHTAEGDTKEIPRILLSIGRCYLLLKQHDSAYFYLNQALQSPGLMYDQQDQAYALICMGELQQDMQCLPEAISLYQQALAISFTNLSRRANLLAKLSTALFATRQYEKSRQQAEACLAIATPHHFQDAQQEAHQTLYQYHKHQQQHALALQHFEQAWRLHDSLAGQDSKTSVIRKETDYLLQKKQQALSDAEARQREQEQLARTQRRYTLGLAITLLMMAILTFYLVRNIQHKRLANIRLSRQREILHQQKDEIETQAARTEQLNKIKDRLLSVMAHDMRSPFSTLQGLLPLLEAGAFSQEQIKTVVAQLSKLTQSTTHMMEDVLLWANAELRGGPANADRLHPADLVPEVFAFLEGPAGAKGITLIQEIPAETTCFGNIGDVRLILRNLISNAVKFTPAGGSIRVSSTIEGSFLQISVADTGTGMTEEQISQLLHAEFVRSTPGTAGEKGTGLGLMLCMEFVQRNGGEMSIASEPGKGSVFSFTLPLAMQELRGLE